nr:uncharacterized protein LOC118062805 isoform X3 [Populus alba]
MNCSLFVYYLKHMYFLRDRACTSTFNSLFFSGQKFSLHVLEVILICIFIKHKDPIWSSNAEPPFGSRKRNEKAYARSAKKYHQDRIRSQLRRESSAEDSGDPETVFHATFGNRWYTWSNKSFQGEPSGFEWREPPKWKDQRFKEWDANRETESDNASYSVGSHSDRTILGLPLTGPLKIEDVKNAFRLSALKWHPDKHQGASQAAAEERFKLCVNAYRSLCDALA